MIKKRVLLFVSILLTVATLSGAVYFGIEAKKSPANQSRAQASTPNQPQPLKQQAYFLEEPIYSNSSAVQVMSGSCVIFWHWRDQIDYLRVCPGDGLVHLNKITNLHPKNETKTWNDWISDYRFENPELSTKFVLYKDNPFQKPLTPYYFTTPLRPL